MKELNPYRILHAQQQALIPSSHLIDGRQERDRLKFLADFATLINFFDPNNQRFGNWQPFLLKDPVFLLATISKTDYLRTRQLFISTSQNLTYFTNKHGDENEISNATNQLFDQLTSVFELLETWTKYMQLSFLEYHLKQYLFREVKAHYCADLWALLALRQNLVLHPIIQDIDRFDEEKFLAYDFELWQKNKNKIPYWEVLGLPNSLDGMIPDAPSLTPIDISNALKKLGNKLLAFLAQVVEYSVQEFTNITHKKSEFPDTILLRAFANLMGIYKQQINVLSQKHLQFYIEKILLQHPLGIRPDSAYICAKPAKKDLIFTLPKGTLFNAGLDNQKKTILFQSVQKESINSALIVKGYTLNHTSSNQIYLKQTPPPDKIQKAENGAIKSWDTFGTADPDATELQKNVKELGFVCASPMFFLQEGERNIRIDFIFEETVDKELFQNTKFYLTTSKSWLEVFPENTILPEQNSPNTISINLNLSASDPSIEAFPKNPEGFVSLWPMFKIEWNSVSKPNLLPTVTSLQISTCVKGLKTSLSLYNDHGALPAQKPFPFLGPSPLQNSGFMVGSKEIFSKPVKHLKLSFYWDDIPPKSSMNASSSRDAFLAYYNQYNNFINGAYNLDSSAQNNGTTDTDSAGNTNTGNTPTTTFENSAFKVSFQYLQGKTWNSLNGNLGKVEDFDKECKNWESSNEEEANSAPDLFELYGEDPKDLSIVPRIFSFPEKENTKLFSPTPSLQLQPLTFSQHSSDGFVKMQLKQPVYGFGRDIYPQVVSSIALFNADHLMERNRMYWPWNKKPPQDKMEIVPPPNPPYTPMTTKVEATYYASKTYDFSSEDDTYPIQCFHMSPFHNYPVYDSGSSDTNLHKTYTLFPQIKHSSTLFLELENVAAPADLTLYFELSTNFNPENNENPPKLFYQYLSQTGWKDMSVLADSTRRFTCSGLIRLSIPEDITTNHPTMPRNNCWVFIATENPPKNFSQTIFYTTNGVKVQRVVAPSDDSLTLPFLPAGKITGPHTAIPEIASIQQPFPSFGGKGAENSQEMNQRVSVRIKTKDRLVTPLDYFEAITSAFPDIYFVKVIRDQSKIKVKIAKKVKNPQESNAFTPLVSDCKIEDIQAYVSQRTSPFTHAEVSNFNMQLVKATISIKVKTGYEKSEMQDRVLQSLNIFLAPWITSDQQQVAIDQSVTKSKVMSFIKSIPGVAQVSPIDMLQDTNAEDPYFIHYNSKNSNTLFIPSSQSIKVLA
ncbi:MAG: hypothetical protein KDD99_00990 [Bacteroidetes bacterium]|nr:hypothetical protein [Bacteroidota bacterium]